MRTHHRRRARGSALVLAILVLFALLGLALLAMRTSTQSIAGSGNVRMTKQARYVAEVGLYHAMTLLAQKGPALLRARAPDATWTLEVRSDGTVFIVKPRPGDDPVYDPVPGNWAAPADLLAEALGDYDGVPSYRVRVEGFTRSSPPAGQGAGGEGNATEIFCAMSFTATGVVSNQEVFDEDDLEDPITNAQYSEHRVKSGVVLGPFTIEAEACRSLQVAVLAAGGGEPN